MTIEQLERAKEVSGKLNELKKAQELLSNKDYSKSIRFYKFAFGNNEITEDKKHFYINDFPELLKMIDDYICGQIKELEKQLEEI